MNFDLVISDEIIFHLRRVTGIYFSYLTKILYLIAVLKNLQKKIQYS